MKKNIIILIGFTLFLASCASGIRFLVSPYEKGPEMRSTSDLGQRKEILWHLDYRILIVHRNESNEILPVQHYRPEHTFGHRIHPLKASFEEPMTMGTLIILKDVKRPIGIAIKIKADTNWRIYWLNDSDIKDLKKTGVVYLPQYKDLPFLEN